MSIMCVSGVDEMFFECFDAVFGLDASFAVEQGDLDEKYEKPPRQDRPQSQAQAWIASQGSRARPDRAGSRSTQKHPGGKERERERLRDGFRAPRARPDRAGS